ncbi:MAG: hypothetical protein M1376_04950 [Planctomycetes bacterium]|nr:hypothetical protein [Planctomycetota bacterium]
MPRKAKSEAKQPSPEIQFVESDSPDGPWTPIPKSCVKVRVLDTDIARLDDPVLDEMVRIDHRTVLGRLGGVPEMLGFARLPLVRKHLGEWCFLRDVRNWLRKRNIDGRDINWTDFCALVQDNKPEDLITLTVCLDRYKVSRATLKRDIRSGRLTSYPMGARRIHRVSDSAAAGLYLPRNS